MTRDFLEERRIMLIREEMRRLDRRLPPHLRELYMQVPILRFLYTAPPKDVVAHRKRFLAEQEAAGNILPSKGRRHDGEGSGG